MNSYTPVQTLAKAHRELWSAIHSLGRAQRLISADLANYDQCVEVGKVLRAMVEEVSKMIRREQQNQPNQRNVRPGADLALKAQLAKARQEVADVLKKRPYLLSHK